VLELRGLSATYARPGWLGRLRSPPPPVVRDIALTLRRGEILGLVGGSGSGKSTILRAIAGLWPRSTGELRLNGGPDLPARMADRPREALRRIQLVFQNPDASLNPRRTVREILARPLQLYHDARPAQVEARARALLAEMRLDPACLDSRPGQLSGGQRQRVALARAFAADPDAILCDEVTSALDVSVQAGVLALLRGLCRDRGTACLFVSHDLAVVEALCDRVLVLDAGRIVETGPTQRVVASPAHPATQALIAAARGPAGAEPWTRAAAGSGGGGVSAASLSAPPAPGL
jgi:peptide/nickel transport system ATP-binding protein